MLRRYGTPDNMWRLEAHGLLLVVIRLLAGGEGRSGGTKMKNREKAIDSWRSKYPALARWQATGGAPGTRVPSAGPSS